MSAPMYSACLFCNQSLGINEAIAQFHVGRRLAYDQATGRLWVVCRNCERWNLSPLETRWEAIEECERAFRATCQRVVSDNIGMAKMRDGTELVRIGKPPEAELAAWRYGDQFRRRYRQHMAATSVTAAAASSVAGAIGFGLVSVTGIVWSIAAVNVVGAFTRGFAERKYQGWKRRTLPLHAVPDARGLVHHFTQDNVNAAMLRRGRADEWELRLPAVSVVPAQGLAKVLNYREQAGAQHDVVLSGADALHGVSAILPHVNLLGGGKKGVRDALDTIQQASSLEALLHMASSQRHSSPRRLSRGLSGHTLALAPERVRLALEMVLHQADERRAMEGELGELEQRWRDADTIAKIADGLLVPDRIDEQLQTLLVRNRQRME